MTRRLVVWWLVALVGLVGCTRARDEVQSQSTPLEQAAGLPADAEPAKPEPYEFTECERAVAALVGDDPDTVSDSHRAHLVADMELWEFHGVEDGSAWVGLAELQLHFGRLDDAFASLKRAKRMRPVAPDLARVEQRAAEVKRLDEKFRAHLRPDHVVIEVDEFAVPGQGQLSAVLCGDPCFPFFPSMTGYSTPEVVLVRATDGATEKLCSSGEALGSRSGYIDCFIEFKQTPVPPDGQRPPCLIVSLRGLSASWGPAHVKVLEWRGDELVEVLGVETVFETGVNDLNGDGVPEIRSYLGFGMDGARSGRSDWRDIYGWLDGQWTLVSDRFPEEFEESVRDLRGDLNKFPDDPSRWYRLGMALQITGREDEALEAYRKSVPMFDERITEYEAEGFPEFAEGVRETRDQAILRAEALAAAE